MSNDQKPRAAPGLTAGRGLKRVVNEPVAQAIVQRPASRLGED